MDWTSPEARRKKHKALQAAIQLVVSTYFAQYGVEHSMSVHINVRDGKLQDWKVEVHHRPIAE